MKTTPDARLLTAASLVRQGAYLADIGTDHAYLPLYLLREGRIRQAIAADIGAGPLARARQHLAEAGYLDRVQLVQTDGLCGLSGRGLTDIAICGMGGELIVRILSDAPFVRDVAVRLILQPMTHAPDLRRYLASAGFRIEEERLCRAAGRIYTCLCASYDGRVRTPSPAEEELGRMPPPGEARDLWCELVRRRMAALTACIAGRESGAQDTRRERELVSLCQELLKQAGDEHDRKTAL